MSDPHAARCIFYARTSSPEPGKYRFARVYLNGRSGDGMLHTRTPPAVGDLIQLWDRSEDGPRGLFRVLERDWNHAMYGSSDWRHGRLAPTRGPLLTITVEEATSGLFRDEYDGDPPEDEDTTDDE
ncbi:hypothetical protein [Nocardia asiatica]|uniref:hypothetical protein n=1 Tax=Nocardia asiatica TaxID=209252 RepID=UPI0024583665|nr:hypothetical protein [Nocardia asiatica]